MRHWPAGPFPYSLTKDLRGERHFCEHWSDLYSYHRPLPRLPARCLHGPAGWSHHLLDFYVMFSTHCPVAMFNMATIKKRKTKRIAKKKCPPWNEPPENRGFPLSQRKWFPNRNVSGAMRVLGRISVLNGAIYSPPWIALRKIRYYSPYRT